MKQVNYPHICRAVFNTPWAITEEKLQVIAEVLDSRLLSQDVAVVQQEIAAANQDRSRARAQGAVAVLPIFGTIAPRMNLLTAASGGASIEGLTKDFRSLMADPNISAIVLDIDSPGGSVEGVDEFASEIFEARGKKKIVAQANYLAASAAYWLGSAASEFVASPSASVGSIGVFAMHTDYSEAYAKAGVKPTIISAGKYKTEGNDAQPLSDDARSFVQARVDEFYGMFVKAVARNRGESMKAVKEGYGQGRVLGAQAAKDAGMVDRVATLDETLGRLVGRNGSLVSAETERSELLCSCGHVVGEESGAHVAYDSKCAKCGKDVVLVTKSTAAPQAFDLDLRRRRMAHMTL